MRKKSSGNSELRHNYGMAVMALHCRYNRAAGRKSPARLFFLSALTVYSALVAWNIIKAETWRNNYDKA